MGTNGAALTMEKLWIWRLTFQDNAWSVTPWYVTNAKVVAGLKSFKGGSSATDGSFLFNVDLQAIGRGPTPLTLNGYPIATTNAIPSNPTKGSAQPFGSGCCDQPGKPSMATALRSPSEKILTTSARLLRLSVASFHSMLQSETLPALQASKTSLLDSEEGAGNGPFFSYENHLHSKRHGIWQSP